MPRISRLNESKIKELYDILERYGGLPTQTTDRKAYANIKYYCTRYGDNPQIKDLINKFNISFRGHRLSFESTLFELKSKLENEGRIPSIKVNQSLYCSVRYFFNKYSDREEVQELKFLYAHNSCYPLPQSRLKRPIYTSYDDICPLEYSDWKRNSAFDYILYVFSRFSKLPAKNTKPMEELKYSIKKWYRYQDKKDNSLKIFISKLLSLGCNEDFIVEVNNSFYFQDEKVKQHINHLLLEHGACAINYLAKMAMPGCSLSLDFVFYYFYNLFNDAPNNREVHPLGELFDSSDYSAVIYPHYRLLDSCDESKIRSRVVNFNRNWDEEPPITIQDWEAYGEYRFFIPLKSSDWYKDDYASFDKSFPKKCIENGHPYFRYYNAGYRYLDFKLFLAENNLILKRLKKQSELDRLTSLNLANANLLLDEDLETAYNIARLDSSCIVDDYGGVYKFTEDGLCLLFAPINVHNYEVERETVIIANNAFRVCTHTLSSVLFGANIKRMYSLSLATCDCLKQIIIPEDNLAEYCQLFPKRCTSLFVLYF